MILEIKKIKEIKKQLQIEPTSQSLDFWSNFWGSVQISKIYSRFSISTVVLN